MIIRSDLRQAPLWDMLLKLKYVKLKELKLMAKRVKQLSVAELQALPLVQTQLTAAREQLSRYRAILEEDYLGMLRLRTYAVVAVGLERLVWVEVLPT